MPGNSTSVSVYTTCVYLAAKVRRLGLLCSDLWTPCFLQHCWIPVQPGTCLSAGFHLANPAHCDAASCCACFPECLHDVRGCARRGDRR
jgi:hypothetical protein